MACYCPVPLEQDLLRPCLVEVVDCYCSFGEAVPSVVDGVVVVYCDVEIDLMLAHVGAAVVHLVENVVG